MSKKFEVVAITGKYTDKDGNEKSRYMNIGAIINTKNGFMLKLEAVPVGWDGWAYLNEPQAKDERPKQAPRRQADRSDPDGDIPFANPLRGVRALVQ